VKQLLRVEDGPIIEMLERPAQGTRHSVSFGRVVDTGELVAVKVELIPGALARERVALTLLGADESPVPRLLAAGAATIGSDRVDCLVIERRAGTPPTSIDGWRRMGRAYARLAGPRTVTGALPALDHATFGAQHAQRVMELGDRLASLAESTSDWTDLIANRVPGAPPLVITHGDPGPGNFLDDGQRGSIIDWEEARIAPRGLDLARLVLIARLGAGPHGYVARDHEERAHAAVNGYLDALSDQWLPSQEESRWWTAVAGVQFIHRRWQRGGQPAPWQDAAHVLLAALTYDSQWTPA
jgi:hypothetical protein